VPAEKRAQSFLQVGISYWLKDACGAFSIYWLQTRAQLTAPSSFRSMRFSASFPVEYSLLTLTIADCGGPLEYSRVR
jgi:hypothetical protein